MPSYLRFRGVMSGAAGVGGCVKINCSSSGIKCMSSVNFLEKLSNKLLDMTKSLQAQFAELVRPPPSSGTDGGGVYIAKIDTPVMNIGVKYEYVLYIQRYGPPDNGIFDETILSELRAELGISAATSL
jgi:hypothetical protein